jgi:hypothetical protein
LRQLLVLAPLAIFGLACIFFSSHFVTLSFFVALVGIIASIIVIRLIKKHNDKYGGKGFAIFALVLNSLFVFLILAFMLILLVALG